MPMPKFTKTPPALIAAFDAAAPKRADVQRKSMFGYPALFVNGNMFASTFGRSVMVRLDDAGRAKAARRGAKPFEVMPGRPMKEYMSVPASDLEPARLKKWIADGLAYTETLPKKKTWFPSPRATSAPPGRVAHAPLNCSA